MKAMMTVEEALARVIASGAPPLDEEKVSLEQAYGRVLVRDLKALRTQPPADVSAMDGYAVRGDDVAAPAVLRVIGEIAAGRPFEGTIGPGEAARIFTGAVMPDGADTVVIQEVTSREGDSVAIKRPEGKGRHVRRKGYDFAAGDVLLRKGQRLTARGFPLRGPFGQHCADFVSSERFGQHFPLFRQIDIERWILINLSVQQ